MAIKLLCRHFMWDKGDEDIDDKDLPPRTFVLELKEEDIEIIKEKIYHPV